VIETELEVLYLAALLLLADCICCLIAAYRRTPVLAAVAGGGTAGALTLVLISRMMPFTLAAIASIAIGGVIAWMKANLSNPVIARQSMDKNLSTAAETTVLLSDGMTEAEIEVRLAIASYLIPRFAGTPVAREAFNALVGEFQDRYPHHKLLSHLLISPEYLEHTPDTLP
jgi:hypothetical protein